MEIRIRDHDESEGSRSDESLCDRGRPEAPADRGAPRAETRGQHAAHARTDDGTRAAAVHGEEVDTRPRRHPDAAGEGLALPIGGELTLRVVSEDVAPNVRVGALGADRHRTCLRGMRL